MRGRLVAITGAFSLSLCIGSARGAALFEAAPGGGTYQHGPNSVSSSGGGTKFVYGNGLISSQTFAAASTGGLRVSARATLSASDANGQASSSGGPPSGGYAAFTFDDFIVHGPASATVSTLATFRIDGAFATDQIAFGPTTSINLGTSVDLQVIGFVSYLDAANSPVKENFSGFLSQTNENGSVVATKGGVLADASPTLNGTHSGVDSLVTTGPITVPVNRPFTFYLEMDAGAGVFADVTPDRGPDPNNPNKVSLQLDGLSDFSHTLTFSSSGPVFDLPGGYTIDSPEAGISNNTYTIPEPSTLAMCLMGLLIASRRAAIVADALFRVKKGGGSAR